ncbi:hypothetical protein TGME49_309530 [Toxoplasma gondii ME49]|uniref:Uncharacterized protein n=4 Tax=Toxoplasma gondii TaxID=5811 RepID=A0A125YGD2_TOXGM|nr:hypothetical protein TGME49_309530 [Toxoplasma gondii ME49]ESS34804.1 putative transmembrane protein [Toxoplasma gondii VEG]KYF47465.1 hypothetical protein TGARI_309530 [Toxoplasma gondii ARI]PIL96908.1 putative transmembrane protein [Toxoplasma gondii COUG]EPT26276.1 hypothetical protein TGME49_309530 [Toxoplasma gondii ME49]CEL77265.1 TPA: hypothetical protein BN1205_093670 [Toxoplasma gondii VEG]|eukprot:XP_018635612.1 hypothetical protein TGME49_309530 [Toxoplasma gondii ME49]
MQTEASVRYHCAHIRDRVAQHLVARLQKLGDPEIYQATISEYLSTVQMGRLAVVTGKTFADLTIVCPFMSTYLKEDVVAREQRDLAIYALSKLTLGKDILRRIMRTKLAFVPVFTPIAGVAWIGRGNRIARRKLSSFFRSRIVEKLRLRQPPSCELKWEIKDAVSMW